MLIRFDETKKSIVFKHESPAEYKRLSEFPAFVRIGLDFGCPAILPVAYNLYHRCLTSFKDVKVTAEFQSWITQPFRLRPLPGTFKFHTSPKDFQEIALRFLYTLGSAGILLDPGMGKSKVILDYIFLMGFKKSVVICPNALKFVWEDEIAKHRPELSCYVVQSTDWQSELKDISANQVLILNYDKAVILKHELKRFGFEFMHLDEFLIKDHSTSRTKALTEISKCVPYKAGGSGTLINNAPTDAFAPIRYLQPALVGPSFTNFLGRYAVMKESVSKSDPSGAKRKVPVAFRGHAEIRSALESCCIVMTKEKWLKLPPKHFHDSYVQPGDDQKAAYYGLLSNYYVQVQGRDIKVDNPLVMLSKLYQISQGFVYVDKEDPDASDWVCRDLFSQDEAPPKKKRTKANRDILFFKQQPKIEKLRELLTTTLKDKKSIIWFNLDGEFELIKSLLDELGENYLSIKGGDKNIGGKVRDFNRTPSIKRLVCQAKSVNYGITVLGSKQADLEKEGIEVLPDLDPSVYVEVFYSLNFSLEVYLQQQDRIHRLGQERDCHYYRIFTNTPIERKIRELIADKVTLKEDMLIDVATTLLKTGVTEELTESVESTDSIS